MNIQNSKSAYQEAVKHIPGGVNSPVRAFNSVGGNPLFIKKAIGARITDIDDNEYIDYVGSWGPMILGHTHADVVNALHHTAINGTSFGAPTLMETEMANLICAMVPSIESVRMVNSGTEATMSALRLARGYTQRDLVIKFEGCYHGHGDSFLIKAGSGALTLGTPNSPGVTRGTASDTLTAGYNNLDSVLHLFSEYKDRIAAVIIEPVTGNMGVIKPSDEFIKGVRKACTDNGALLIFDEVMTGFRVAKGGAQELLGITPDLTTLGKIIGGGLPVGAYGGKKEIMDMLAPNGPVYQAGTLSGNPMAMAAGLTTLKILNETEGFYDRLEEKAAFLADGLQKNMDDLNFPGVINRVGSMFTLFFTNEAEVNNFSDVMKCDTELFAQYFRLGLESGIYAAPSQFEAGFVSIAHTNEDLQTTIDKSFEALKQLK
ncbi:MULTISPECIES: glutamate-1-semialdehyde 2,1-aminomutase [unclassified Saccharicrinis]|uniref:glutamate-1-semialdehyde 2,1-aminomutase n=1 Tax=unclassified Saccharicrinis TaxID=2646859 RepID=UPI003D33C866